MSMDKLTESNDFLNYAEKLLENFYQNIERKKNKIICKTKITTEFIIDDINKKTHDGFILKRCYSAITTIPSSLNIKIVSIMNNFSALSSLVLFEDEEKIKFINRFYEYEGETIHKQFLIPSLLTATISNEKIINQISKKIVLGEDFSKDINYDESSSRWLLNNEFQETETFLKNRFYCNSSDKGLTVEFPWEEGSVSAALGHKTSLLQFLAEEKHPYFGSGLFCKLSLPVVSKDKPEIVNKLNLNEFSNPDSPPFIGSWCAGFVGNQTEFVCFFPNNIYFKGIVKNFVSWMLKRSVIAKDFLEKNNL